MQFAVGNIVEGKVTGITKFGAFVELPGGKTGMVHISEVASTYVKEIRDHISENQVIKVKVLNISEEGKISLSIKKAMDPPSSPAASEGGPSQPSRFRGGNSASRRPSSGYEWNAKPRTNENMSFEDMLSKFKQTSDDKMSDLKKYTDGKRGASGGRRGQSR